MTDPASVRNNFKIQCMITLTLLYFFRQYYLQAKKKQLPVTS